MTYLYRYNIYVLLYPKNWKLIKIMNAFKNQTDILEFSRYLRKREYSVSSINIMHN